ncbi:hypothetical protein [Streptomyces sp. ISL-98]|nr:hypothetical protein [Streptomyces sp. ISL-98]
MLTSSHAETPSVVIYAAAAYGPRWAGQLGLAAVCGATSNA